VNETPILGVRVVPLATHVDDRGYLSVLLRNDHPDFTAFGQVYLVGNHAPGTIRAWHKHSVMWDWFVITHGSAKFGLVDDRKDSPSYEKRWSVTLAARAPALLSVPPGVFHGWMSLEPDTQLISIADQRYGDPGWDEVRVPHDHFADFAWRVEYR
jgi:dTDP-4-dehydrorhamnose 3,5-epimerase